KAVTTDSRGRFTLHGIGKSQGVGLQIRDPRYAIQSINVPPPKTKEAEVTRVVSQARLLEGTVTDADTGKPIVGAHVHIPSPRNGLFGGAGVFFEFAGRSDADWKGRRVNLNQYLTLAYAGGPGGANSDEVPSIDVFADREGRFRIPLFLASSYQVSVTAP